MSLPGTLGPSVPLNSAPDPVAAGPSPVVGAVALPNPSPNPPRPSGVPGVPGVPGPFDTAPPAGPSHAQKRKRPDERNLPDEHKRSDKLYQASLLSLVCVRCTAEGEACMRPRPYQPITPGCVKQLVIPSCLKCSSRKSKCVFSDQSAQIVAAMNEAVSSGGKWFSVLSLEAQESLELGSGENAGRLGPVQPTGEDGPSWPSPRSVRSFFFQQHEHDEHNDDHGHGLSDHPLGPDDRSHQGDDCARSHASERGYNEHGRGVIESDGQDNVSEASSSSGVPATTMHRTLPEGSSDVEDSLGSDLDIVMQLEDPDMLPQPPTPMQIDEPPRVRPQPETSEADEQETSRAPDRDAVAVIAFQAGLESLRSMHRKTYSKECGQIEAKYVRDLRSRNEAKEFARRIQQELQINLACELALQADIEEAKGMIQKIQTILTNWKAHLDAKQRELREQNDATASTRRNFARQQDLVRATEATAAVANQTRADLLATAEQVLSDNLAICDSAETHLSTALETAAGVHPSILSLPPNRRWHDLVTAIGATGLCAPPGLDLPPGESQANGAGGSVSGGPEDAIASRSESGSSGTDGPGGASGIDAGEEGGPRGSGGTHGSLDLRIIALGDLEPTPLRCTAPGRSITSHTDAARKQLATKTGGDGRGHPFTIARVGTPRLSTEAAGRHNGSGTSIGARSGGAGTSAMGSRRAGASTPSTGARSGGPRTPFTGVRGGGSRTPSLPASANAARDRGSRDSTCDGRPRLLSGAVSEGSAAEGPAGSHDNA